MQALLGFEYMHDVSSWWVSGLIISLLMVDSAAEIAVMQCTLIINPRHKPPDPNVRSRVNRIVHPIYIGSPNSAQSCNTRSHFACLFEQMS
jgi:hypothetical protein